MHAIAPGKPGIDPRWTSSAKIGMGTAMSPHCNLWFTISHGIINEVYYPRIDTANIRDFGLIVTDGKNFFSEEKRNTSHEYTLIEEGIPAYHLINTCLDGRYRIEKRVIADPSRNVLLQEVTFVPLKGNIEDYHLYFLLSPHINNAGGGNNGWVGESKGVPVLFAERNGISLACTANVPLISATCGYVGSSDAWQDLHANKRLTKHYPSVSSGNIALAAEIDMKSCNGKCVIALGFAPHSDEAALQSRISLERPFEAILEEYLNGWKKVKKSFVDLSDVDKEGAELYWMSTAVLNVHEGKHFSGAIIASLSIPWGFSKGDYDLGGYHLVWPRDQVNASFGFLAAGCKKSARAVLLFLICTQEPDGHWVQCMWEDGIPYWHGIQMDETALPILLADTLKREDALGDLDPRKMVFRASRFLIKNGPSTEQGRWEEDTGFSPYTIATEIAALLAAADFFEENHQKEESEYLKIVADWWYDSLDRWMYVSDTTLSKNAGVEGYYIRVTPNQAILDPKPENDWVTIQNRPQGENCIKYQDLVSIDALALVRFGIRDANDPRIRNTVKVIDQLLMSETSKGPIWHRYNEDGYGEKQNGDPFDGTGIGRGWPLLIGERAHYELAKGDKKEAIRLLRVFRSYAGVGGLFPEQIWEKKDLPEKRLYNGHSSGSAKPLVWAHAEYITLLRSLKDGQIFTTPPQTIERYLNNKTIATHAIWSFDFPCPCIPYGKKLRIQLNTKATVHYSFDGWNKVQDCETITNSLDVHYVDLPTETLSKGSTIIFTFFWTESAHWEGNNFTVVVV